MGEGAVLEEKLFEPSYEQANLRKLSKKGLKKLPLQTSLILFHSRYPRFHSILLGGLLPA
jgi:hypothetical protein